MIPKMTLTQEQEVATNAAYGEVGSALTTITNARSAITNKQIEEYFTAINDHYSVETLQALLLILKYSYDLLHQEIKDLCGFPTTTPRPVLQPLKFDEEKLSKLRELGSQLSARASEIKFVQMCLMRHPSQGNPAPSQQ